jgi:Tfp pilus assembly protein PilF
MAMKRIGMPLGVALLMTACASPFMRDTGLDQFAPRKAEQDLSAGIRAYEDGEYRSAAQFLQDALAAGLLLNSDKVAAHKHLAFIHCAQARERSCREAFREALALDPELELAPAEAGHPMWGPVFKSLKRRIPAPP